MKLVAQALPEPVELPLEALLWDLRDTAIACARPFAPETVATVGALSMALLRDPRARRFPELQALGFWLRPAAVERLRQQFLAMAAGAVLVPRGVVLHVPPANVDTIFVYSWVLSMLVGNRNVVRLPSLRSQQNELLMELLHAVLAEHPAAATSTIMLRYGHDDAITAALSQACDMRVIWGGDETIRHIRSLPLPPHATEMVFPDRFSLAVMDAAAVQALQAPALDQLAEAFFNDVYWFDQMACSSPRVLYWIGEAGSARGAAGRFAAALEAKVCEKSYTLDSGTSVAKLSRIYNAILDHPVAQVWSTSNRLAILTLEAPADLRGETFAAGTLFQYALPDLSSLVPLIRRKDQTLTYFGFDPEALRNLAVAINGRGIDRIVPVGQALTFSHIWDGFNFITQMTRQIAIS